MLEPKAPFAAASFASTYLERHPAAEPRGFGVQSASTTTRRSRSHSRPTVLVVHSRSQAARFRILSTHAPSPTEVPVSIPPVSFLQGHRTCQKAKDCDGDETSDRYQR